MDKLIAELRRRDFFRRFGGKSVFGKDHAHARIIIRGKEIGVLSVFSQAPAMVKISIANSMNRLCQEFRPESPDQFCRQLDRFIKTSIFIK